MARFRATMHPDLQRAHDGLGVATAGLDPASLAAGPAGKWTVAQIVEHLAKGYAGTAHVLGRCLDQDQPKARAVTVKDRVLAFVVVDLGYLPEGRLAPEATRPSDAPAPFRQWRSNQPYAQPIVGMRSACRSRRAVRKDGRRRARFAARPATACRESVGRAATYAR